MKKIIILFVLLILLTILTNPAMAADNASSIKVQVNGQLLQFPDQQPVIENNRILIPLRTVGEALNFNVSWDENTQTAFIDQNGTKISITVDSSYSKINKEPPFRT